MGEIVTEQLHIAVKAKVLQNARLEYACRNGYPTGIKTHIVVAPMPQQPLPGSIATASTLAFALIHNMSTEHRSIACRKPLSALAFLSAKALCATG